MNITGICVVAMTIVSIECAAQSAGQAASPPGQVVAVGCINRAVHSGSLAATPGVPPATPKTAEVLANTSEPTNSYVLNGVVPPADAAHPAESEKAALTPPTSYVLDGKLEEFEAHNGHHVEVTGTLVKEQAAPGSEMTKSNAQHLQVSAIRMLGPTCPKPPDATPK